LNKYSIQYLSEGIIKKIESGEFKTYRPSKLVPTLEIENFTTGGITIDTIFTDKSYYTTKGKEDMISIFGDNEVFSYPKPVSLLKDILSRVVGANDIVLDSFAGSGTTAHAVLKLNKEDGGNRKFILVEMMDYAESITAERVKRVISGYGEGSKAVEGTGGSFGYYELGAPLMIGENLNEELSVDKIREYVWYTETRGMGNGNGELGMGNGDDPYLLGVANDTAYYFCYEKSKAVTLDRTLLKKLKTKAGRYVIYADICLLDEAELERFRITFKKIPRDIVRL
jgi:adenine-specific DNA-methyltransferase